MRRITQLIIHCSASAWGNAAVIRDWHVNGNGWDDIGYHYVIPNGRTGARADYDPAWDGILETGRALSVEGAHARGQNHDSIGICLIGEGDGLFTPRQIKTLTGLVDVMCTAFQVPPTRVFGHRDYDRGKSCPGFDVAAWVRGG